MIYNMGFLQTLFTEALKRHKSWEKTNPKPRVTNEIDIRYAIRCIGGVIRKQKQGK
jgi:hypothetical protein